MESRGTHLVDRGADALGLSCGNWTGSSAGVFGNALSTGFAWTAMCQLNAVCASTAALYCVEQ